MRRASRLLLTLSLLALGTRAARAEEAVTVATSARTERPSALEVTVSGPFVGADLTYRRWLTRWLGVEVGVGHMQGNCDSEAAQHNFDVMVSCSFVTGHLAATLAAGSRNVWAFVAAGVTGGLAVSHPVGPFGSDAPLLLPMLEVGLHLQTDSGLYLRPALMLASGGPIGLSIGVAF